MTLQATVKHWDAEQGGAAFLDNGTTVALPPECLQRSEFRLLRLGQRIQLELHDGVVVAVHLPT